MKHPARPIERNVAVVGCKHTTGDLILGLHRHGFRVDHCITIDPAKAEVQQVAGYVDLRPFLEEHEIPYTVAHKYSLKSEGDQERLLALGLDMLLVMGWQRLIPDWFLTGLSIGAFGMHGSSRPLPHGRGRSPMNWSLIQNKNVFYTHLFQYMPGVDDGPVVGVQTFDITPFDSCLSLHFKNTVAMIQLCRDNLPQLLDGTAELTPQSTEGASYYPKRSAEDGLIYWSDTTQDVYNLIRAVTYPFPGAFTYLDNHPARKVMVWEAIPFDTRLRYPEALTGEVLEVFYNGDLVVRTGDSTLLVREYEGHRFDDRDVGRRFGDLGTPRKVWENLPT
jgi:methionyl-tRNA formyltransferase